MSLQYPQSGEKVRIEQDSPSPSDLTLLQGARAGDDVAFETLMGRHTARLHRLAYSLIGNDSDADDVLQETFIGALKGLKSFRTESSVKTWFTRILINQVARHRRYWRVRSNMRQMGEDSEAILSGLPPKKGPNSMELRLDIAEMLQTLSPEHRVIIALREMDGLAYDEIAAILDVPVGTVESRLFRARQELRGRLKVYLNE